MIARKSIRFAMEINVEHYQHTYTNQAGDFVAQVNMNGSDAMSAAYIKALPQDNHEAKETLKTFAAYFYKRYGAKACFRIDPKLYASRDKEIFSDLTPGEYDAEYAGAERIKQVMQTISNKPAVEAHLRKFSAEEDGYKLLDNESLKGREEELSALKILHSSFASHQKIDNNLYSVEAEKRKLANPATRVFAVEHKGKLIATSMSFIEGDTAYDSDFLVHPNFRDQKFAQAFGLKMHSELLKTHGNIAGVWFIAGGYGKEPQGYHLYREILGSGSLNAKETKLQTTAGLFLKFGPPGPEMYDAANRDMQTGKSMDKPEELAKAHALFDTSQEKKLAAPQPEQTASSMRLGKR